MRYAIDFTEEQTARATEMANTIEKLFDGQEIEAVTYALGMVIAHMMAHAKDRDSETGFNILRAISDHEIRRQFSN